MKKPGRKLMSIIVILGVLTVFGNTRFIPAIAGSTTPAEDSSLTPIPVPATSTKEETGTRGTWDWYDGAPQYSTVPNCVAWYSENGAASYVGYWADPDNMQPKVGSVYYIHVVIYGLGNPCAGTLSLVEIGLPPSTSLAISATKPVYCYWDGDPISPPSDCPQTLPLSVYNSGFYTIPSPGADDTWPLPQGHNWEFQVPVKTNTAISGKNLTGATWMIDGNSSPWLYPTAFIYVFAVPKPGAFNKISPANGAKGISWAPTLKWGVSTKAVSYQYCIDKINNNTCDTGWKSAGKNTSVTLSGLVHGKVYYWQVRAKNAGGTTLANSGTWWRFTTKP